MCIIFKLKQCNLTFRRILSDILDYFLIWLVGVYASIKILPDFNMYDFSMNDDLFFILGVFIIFLTLCVLKDCVFGNASIGKKIFGIKIVYANRENNGKIDLLTHLKRAVTSLLLFQIELVLVIIKNKRIGDIWAKTEVVRDKKQT